MSSKAKAEVTLSLEEMIKLEAERDQLKAQRDELLVALKALYPHIHEDGVEGESEFERAWLKVEAAIQKAEQT